MQDLTTGSLTRHLLKTTGFMLVMMVFQTLYFLIDLYWVGRLGTAAVAGVGIAGNLTFIVLALSQMLGVGTTSMISHGSSQRWRFSFRLRQWAPRCASGRAFFLPCLPSVSSISGSSGWNYLAS